MANIRTLQRSFAGGEVSPEMYGRLDDAKYQSGLAVCRNFIPKPQGQVEKRAGLMFVRAVKDSTKKTRLIPFTFSTTQTMAIELGAGYFRFHTGGASLLVGAPAAYNAGTTYAVGDLVASAGVNYYSLQAGNTGNSPATSPVWWYAEPSIGVYEIPNPYAEADLFDIHYVQSADVLTLVHPNYPPSELRRLGATKWVLANISFAPVISPPPAPVVSSSGFTVAKYTYSYVVTAIAADGLSESAPSPVGSVSSNLYETGCTNVVNWTPVNSASMYRVYKLLGGLYGYVGQTSSTFLKDDNIAADLSKTPPNYDRVFAQKGISSVPVTAGGSGYGTSSVNGNITGVNIVAGGTGYPAPTLTVSDPTGSGATFSVTRDFNGVITGVTVLTQGTGYTSPTLVLQDTAGSGARLSANVNPVVKQTATLQVADATGTGAVLAPILNNGVLTGVQVLDPGQNYTNPTISFLNAAGGAGATFGPAVLTDSGYPGAVSYFEQRRLFAGTVQKPQNLWMTKSATESNMAYSLPSKDDDRISIRVAARESNTIRHIVPLNGLVLLTNSAEWRVTSVNSDAITPSSVSVRPQSYVGANNAQPVIINNNLVYAAARGGHVRELAYSWQVNGFATGDLSLRAAHLFDTFDILDMAYAKAPLPIIWMVSSSGKLLGLTYVPEQQVGAWHQHDTDGVFESCTVVAEGGEDFLYCVVRRTINGASVRYIERMATRLWTAQADAFYVDAGLTYSGAAATVISGLSHLEGKTVNILADGAVHPRRVVTGGSITLDQAAIKVQVGLPITSDLQTLPVSLQIDGFGQGRMKNINRAWLRVYRSGAIFIGSDASHLTEAKQRTTEMYGTPPALKSEEIPLMLPPNWTDSGSVFVRHTDPVPLAISALTAEVALGG